MKNDDVEISEEFLKRSELAVNVANRIVSNIRIQRLRITNENKKMKGGRSKQKCLEDWKKV